MTQISSATSTCGIFTLQGQRRNINNFVKKVYLACFKVPLGDQDKNWALHKVCKAVLKLCDHGLRERMLSWSLVCQWFGENQQTIWITATSNLSMYQVSIWKPNNTYNAIYHLPDNQLHTNIQQQYISHNIKHIQGHR